MTSLPSIQKNYINGAWVAIDSDTHLPVVQPATEETIDHLPMSNPSSVDSAVQAARQAFATYSRYSVEQRLTLLDRIVERYDVHFEAMAYAISTEMGAPITMSRNAQAGVGAGLLRATRRTLKEYAFAQECGTTHLHKEPIGVAGMITPWNWPMNQVVAKVSAALAAGCCMVLKPSEYSPYSAALFAKILHDAGVPSGVFNLVFGGADCGAALAAHNDVDMISITGSTRAGVAVAQAAAPSVKRVTQELGGKSPMLILPGSDVDAAVNSCITRLLLNSGQSCNAPTRLLVHREQYQQVIDLIPDVVSGFNVGDPQDPATDMGPLVNALQFQRVNELIQSGIEEGAEVIVGGNQNRTGKGFFVEPTVFGNVNADMRIVREEIFGPVLCVMTYSNKQEAVAMANDSEYGLSAYVFAADESQARDIANELRAGMVHINAAPAQLDAPFGGYRMSGNGRERGEFGIEEYLETKAVFI